MKKCILQLIIIILVVSGCSRTDDPLPYEEGKIIILMYHRITEGEASNLYERSAADFESDLMYLINNKINIISFSDLESVKESGKMPEGHSAIICFDDGDHSGYITAMPLLMKYRMNATFFLWAEMIGHDSFLTWEEVLYMSYMTFPGGIRPFTFGSHSYSHQFLFGRKESFSTTEEYNSFLDYELGISKSLIETYTPGEVTVLALPFGDGAGDPDIIAAAQRNGYRFIRTSIYGAIEDPDLDLFCIPSLPMLDQTDPEEIGYYLNK
ncbi:MAG: polysaccharide deacetylase family protein [Bacteroidales bacterium]|nr:polysaccharide deacetylase family protein [Bacteroidales bacterium]